MTPEIVLKTSGHVDKFTDNMVKDVKTGDCFRADKLIEDGIAKLLEAGGQSEDEIKQMKKDADAAGAMGPAELDATIAKYKFKSPELGNDLTPSFPFNLMFATQIGPTGKFQGFLRPETAQGIFINFRRLLEYNGGRMPFASAQIGQAFRNEIAPRAGLLRVREFALAEIEHFVNPDAKLHPKFKNVKDYVLDLLPRELQDGENKTMAITAGEAVEKKVIDNETLAYFMCRTHMFLLTCGIKPSLLRFRQHKADEMAHYAKVRTWGCWRGGGSKD